MLTVPMITRLFSDSSGETHFEPLAHEQLRLLLLDRPHPTSAVSFVVVPATHPDGIWHNAPRRQLVVWLHGNTEVESSAGERYDLRPGDALLVEDINGKGHCNHHRGEIHLMFVHLVEGIA